ncbi:MAG: sensor histidine kinase [Burkholderiales bacterium]
MSPIRLLRTTSFRLTAIYAALFAVSAGLLFGMVYWIATNALHEQARLSLDSELTALEAKFRSQSLNGLAAEISQRVRSGTYRPILYLLEDASGGKLAGNLPTLEPIEGWREFPLEEEHADPTGDVQHEFEADSHRLLVLGRHRSDGSFLAVGTDTHRTHEAQEAMLGAFAGAMGATLLLALGGGALLSRGFLRRIEDINRTTRAIMGGDLSERVRTHSAGDEFDQLAANLNEMLDRLQNLMEGLRQVSNDIAHDLRTPLGRLRQRLEAARLEVRSVDSYELAIDQALQDADAALSTFSALLRIAQIESGTRRASFTDLDFSGLVEHLVMTYSAVAEDLGKRLTSKIAPSVRVRGDRELLTQMFVNLIENALRHTPDGATVSVALDIGGECPVAVIADDGPGVPEPEREKILRRFYRLETSRTTPGSGLGLALVAAVAELHHIRIHLADNQPGLRVTLEF